MLWWNMKKNKKINEKYYSFLNATILGRNERIKFPEVFNIPIYDKANWKFGHLKYLNKRNKRVLHTILQGYFIFWFAIFCATHMFYEEFKQQMLLKDDNHKKAIWSNVFNKNIIDINILYYFFKYSFDEFFEANDYLRDISESYMCDINYFEQQLNKYNLSFFFMH